MKKQKMNKKKWKLKDVLFLLNDYKNICINYSTLFKTYTMFHMALQFFLQLQYNFFFSLFGDAIYFNYFLKYILTRFKHLCAKSNYSKLKVDTFNCCV